MADTAMLMQKALQELRDLRAKVARLEGARTEPIAIIGIGCRFPGADSPDAYWKLLRNGVCSIGPIPEDRWDVEAFYDPDPAAPGKMHVREGGFLERVDEFDPLLFGISPREAAWMDPQQRLFLEVCWEALERAGYAPDSLSGAKTGVFAGISSFNYATLLLGSRNAAELDPFFGTGNALSVLAGRVSYTLGLNGPALAVDTACSSSLVALHLACESLRRGECDMALAGGVGLILTPETTIGFCKAGMLSRDARCKTFDASADGYVRGEGAGAIVLKRLADAISAGDPIIAAIRGSATNHDGHSTGLTVPNGPAQRAVIEAALTNGAVDTKQVAFVEAHGTGTSLGDPIELGALGALFGGRDVPLLLGSAKTNLGHLEAAAGIAGVIKVALAMQHGEIPPHLHLPHPTPLFDWDAQRLQVATKLTPWPADLPCAGVSSFGFSGTNSHVVLERSPAAPARPDSFERPLHLFTLSARSEEALDALRQRHLAASETAPFPDVCFTANAGRAQFAHRAAIVAASPQDLATAPVVRGCADREPRVAFLFTGQGSQYAGMGRELYETQPSFRKTLDRCAAILHGEIPIPLIDALYGPAGRLHETALTQPALFALEYGLAKLWMSWGIVPVAAIGHSLGEYVAACVAGVFDLEAGLKLAALRGRLMDALPRDGEMIAVLAPLDAVAPFVERHSRDVSFAGLNGPTNVVISGRRAVIQAISAELTSAGIAFRPLQVSHAFHSPLMDPMLPGFTEAAARIPMAAPTLTVISNVTGQPLAFDRAPNPDYWSAHIRQPVRFEEGVRALAAENIDLFLEVGPSPTLLGMARQCLANTKASFLPSLRPGQSDWKTILGSLGQAYVSGARVDWTAFDRDYPRRRVGLPTYPFERQRYWAAPRPSEPVDDCVFAIEWSPLVPAPLEPKRSWRIAGAPDLLHLPSSEPHVGTVYVAGEQSGVDHCAALLDILATGHGPIWIVLGNPLEGAPLCGLAKSIRLESPERYGGLIELDPSRPAQEQTEIVARILAGASGADREVRLRDDEMLVPRLQKTSLSRSPSIRADATYLVTGGTGGVGQYIAQSLIDQGARHVVVTSRSASPAMHPHLRIERADVANEEEMSAVLRHIADSGMPLAGVIHAAGVLDDGLLSTMSRDRFAAVMRPKVDGAWVLHRLTEKLPLDFFVLCSSAASVLGAAGQSNYAAANAGLDTLAVYRRQRGLPAVSLNWGPWSGTGMFARSPNRTAGIEPLTPSRATKILMRALAPAQTQLLILNADWPVLARRFSQPPAILADLLPRTESSPDPRERLNRLAPEQRREWLVEHVQEKAAEILRLPTASSVPPHQGFFDLGMDSLLAVELRNRLESAWSISLPATTTFEYSSAGTLAGFLEQTLHVSVPADDDELARLIDEELERLEGVLRA